LDGAAFTACTSPTSYAGLVEGAHKFAVKAVDPAGHESAAASYSWKVDLTPPAAPKLTSKPANVTDSTSASFAFTDADASASFFCRLDGAAFAGCASPKAYAGLSAGQHVFDVKARDPAGNEGAITSYTWTIDLTNAVVTIDPASEPLDPTNITSASFTFSSNKPGSTFACAFDGAAFAPCTSPVSYSGLPDARHSFAVKATALGTTGPASVWAWTVDTIPPATLDAFRDHGVVARTVDADLPEADRAIADIEAASISMGDVTDQLLRDGIASFQKSYDSLLAGLERKRSALV